MFKKPQVGDDKKVTANKIDHHVAPKDRFNINGNPAIIDSNNQKLLQAYIPGDEESLVVNSSFTITIKRYYQFDVWFGWRDYR